MASKLRLLTKRIIIIANSCIIILFLLACLSPYLNPGSWWFITFLGLAFPFLLFFLIVFFIAWLIVKPKYSFFSLGALILGIKGISVFFAFHFSGRFKYE